MRHLWIACVTILALAGCEPAPVLIISPDGTDVQEVHLHAWLADHPLDPHEARSAHELGRSDTASFHIVQVRTQEPPHVHEDHDAVVRIERGHGTLYLGTHELHLVPGSILNIPRGIRHYFVNDSPQPTVAFVVFSPPFDGKDTVLVTE